MFSAEDENCKNCGKPKPVKTMDPELVQHIARATGVILYDTQQDKTLDGINGWLWFWCFSRTVLMPVGFVGSYFGLYSDRNSTELDLIGIILGFFQTLLSVITGYKVWTKSHDAKYFIYAYYAFDVLSYGILFLIVLYFSDSSRNFNVANIVIGAGYYFFTTLVWVGYFRFSKRVLQTFGENFFRFQ